MNTSVAFKLVYEFNFSIIIIIIIERMGKLTNSDNSLN